MAHDNTNLPARGGEPGGGSPFDRIRRMDEYGREYWDGREMQPLMDYASWREFDGAVMRARSSLALVQGKDTAQDHFVESHNMVAIGSGAVRRVSSYRLTRFGAYLVAMAGDDQKKAVAEARVYFAVRTREAELTALTNDEVRNTALARAREMVDYKIFRDMMRDNAPDYEPSSKATQLFFAAMQNRLYLHVVGLDARQIIAARELMTWPGREEGKPEPSSRAACRRVAKNYLTPRELVKLDRLVGRLCLRAEDIADDRLNLTLLQWEMLVDREIAMAGHLPLTG